MSRQLRKILSDHFDSNDIKKLCLAIGANYQDAGLPDRSVLVRGLVHYSSESNQLERLVASAKEIRPVLSWPESPSIMSSGENLKQISQVMVQQMTDAELLQVCTLMGVDHENIATGSPTTSPRDLIGFARRRRMMPEFLRAAKEVRPDLDWTGIT